MLKDFTCLFACPKGYNIQAKWLQYKSNEFKLKKEDKW